MVVNDDRFFVVPYKSADKDGKPTEEFKLMEARSLFDIQLNEGIANIDGDETLGDRGKIDTVGIYNDKSMAMIFLVQPTTVMTKDDSAQSSISYVDFEQFFMEISDPMNSPIMRTIYQVLSNNLKVGFFNPSGDLYDTSIMQISMPVGISNTMAKRTILGAIVGLEENRYRNYDAFAAMFKVGKSGERNAPQDRMNVTKAGQSRGLSDTKVYFATQNGIGSDMIINAAARNQYFIEHKEQLQKAMNDLYVADSIYRSAIAKMKAEACKDEDPDADADSEACAAAKAKSTDQYLAENPELKKAKDDADAIAAALTAKLREDNKNGLILEADLDAADSPVNFDRQVSVLRSMLASQIDLIKSSIAMLKAADREQLDTVISLVVSGLKRFQKQNQQMEAVQLIAAGFNFVGEVGKAKDLEVKINSNLTITGYMLARVMMNTAKIENTLDQQLTYIDGLATYTGMVDPDSVLQ
jgi:hypothetical protein